MASCPVAHAIPQAVAFEKLEVVPVFVLADPRGLPLLVTGKERLFLPMYLERSVAQRRSHALSSRDPTVQAQVVAVPLSVMLTKITELSKQLLDRSRPLVAYVVGDESDHQHAFSLLSADGFTDKQIKEGLGTPVFFTKPFLSIKTQDGPRSVFYMSYQELQNNLAKLPTEDRDKFKPQVADLTAVLREIINSPQDDYVIFPTPEYFRLVQENRAQQGSKRATN